MSATPCYHCGLPVPSNTDFVLELNGQPQRMCCVGCLAVASAIQEGGLEKFYQYRRGQSPRPDKSSRPDQSIKQSLKHYDLPEIQADYVTPVGELHRIQLLISGITCAACGWLIEQHLSRYAGVTEAQVNVASHRVMVTWDLQQLPLSELLEAFNTIGYEAKPVSDEEAQHQRLTESRRFIQRLGVAGLGMMQAGMVAVGLYASTMGQATGMDPVWQQYLRWVSLVITLPIVLFSAQPFFRGALRSLQLRRLTMDVPVSLAIALAFGASCWATMTQQGEVYFDSVAMFTFFLLLGRYLEMRVRHRNDRDAASLSQLLPDVATRLEQGQGGLSAGTVSEQEKTVVPIKLLQPDDRVFIKAGETIPCDGVIESGVTSVVEAVLSGEAQPVLKQQGDVVSAGTVNGDTPIIVRVTASVGNTRLSNILRLVEMAKSQKPVQVALADRVAGYFVAVVLVIALTVGVVWFLLAPDKALWVVLSVLVVTCPCAFSLATPAVLAVAISKLRKHGFLVSDSRILMALSSADTVVFDKTGTLTTGDMVVHQVLPLGSLSEAGLQQLAASLEQGSAHPIASAFSGHGALLAISQQKVHPASGVSGIIEGEHYTMGKPDFVAGFVGCPVPELPCTSPSQLPLLLASQQELLGWIILEDQVRDEVVSTVRALQNSGLQVVLLSGDRPETVKAMADHCGINEWEARQSPEQKLAWVKSRQQSGEKVLMVGDGINDVPVLSGADGSIAMGDATDFAHIHADGILLSSHLNTLVSVRGFSQKTQQIIRQNICWALAYNLLAVPLAALGWIPPWAAAIGMSISSLLVVCNALRLDGYWDEPPGVPLHSGSAQMLHAHN